MPLVPPVTSTRLPVNSVSEEVLIGVSPLEPPLAASCESALYQQSCHQPQISDGRA
jgi:hypothetical protein